MQGHARGDVSQEPRFGEDPPPGHWARDWPVPGYLAHGFDCLAEQAGAADGLALLLTTCRVTASTASTASAWQFREWFYACYRAHSRDRMALPGDVAVVRRGILGADTG